MKKYLKNIMLICTMALGVMACTKDEIDTFSGTDELYFKWAVDGFNDFASDKIDSISVSFAFDLPEVTDSIFMVPVKVLGNTSSMDRPFSIQALPTSTATEGVDFVLPQSLVIPANSITANVPITLLRTPEMKNGALSIQFELVPNEYFKTDYFGTAEDRTTKELLKYDEFEVTVSDILEKPKFWSPFMDYYLGDFTAKKLILYATVNGIPIPNWNLSPPDLGTFFGRKNILKAYLIEQASNGTPVLEDDGTEMKLGPFA